MLQKDNQIELKVGDIFRFNRARKKCKVVNMFEFNGKTYFNYIDADNEKYPSFHTTSKDILCGIDIYYDNFYDGVVEVNGCQVRGTGGKILSTPKPVQEKAKKDSAVKKELTDFQKFYNVQCSGRINMTDIVTGSRLAGISEQKYEDILFHYDEYKSGKRQ